MKLETLVKEVYAHAEQEQPHECCGLAVVVKGKLQYVRCRNVAQSTENVKDWFQISPEDWAAAEDKGEIVGVCHSHVYAAPTPSEADRVSCERSGVPWLIVNWPVGSYMQVDPEGYEAPLEGRHFAHGVLDCYQIVVDYYKREEGIELPNFERVADWWINGENLYLDGFPKAGFEQVGDGSFTSLQKGDVLLMQVASPVPNHAAVYVGDDQILQHLYGRLSSRYPYDGYWKKHTTHVLRHQSKK